VPQNFIDCDREQELLLPPSLREWLPDDHLAWLVLDAVDEIDLSAFYAAYREDGWGRAAFDPLMMVALLLYAYAVGERSSRGIERRCREDVAFRVITANRIPDHATIARFRARHEQALAATFTQVLALCARAGLVSVGVVALDGSLLSGNASPQATRSYASIRAEVELMLGEAAQADAAEDERLGDARGDELPAELADARSRRERLRRCKEQLERAQADEEAAYQANLAWRAGWEAEHGRRLAGRKPTRPDPAALAERKINTTDPDTRLMKRAGGKSVQGYNAQVVASPGQVIVAAQVTQSHNDADQLEPMSPRLPRRCARRASRGRSGLCSPTVATGTRPRSARCGGGGSTCSSPRGTVGAAPRASSHPAKAGKQSGSRPCSRHRKDRRSTAGGSRSWNQSSRTRK
jgi:transposase